jgi:uncharacterized protein (DUF849 family)
VQSLPTRSSEGTRDRKVWLEVALNGPWSRARQPGIPVAVREDAPFGSRHSNVQWVEEAVRAIRAAGGQPASAADVRTALA